MSAVSNRCLLYTMFLCIVVSLTYSSMHYFYTARKTFKHKIDKSTIQRELQIKYNKPVIAPKQKIVIKRPVPTKSPTEEPSRFLELSGINSEVCQHKSSSDLCMTEFIRAIRKQQKKVNFKDFVFGYCVYPQWLREDKPVREPAFLVNRFMQGMPRTSWGVPYFVDPTLLPPDIPDAMQLLGATEGFNLRFCTFGSSQIVKYLQTKGAMLDKVQVKPLKHYKLHVPPSVYILTRNKKPINPIIVRDSHEAWDEYSRGVGIQLETKYTTSNQQISLYNPILITLIGRRLPIHKWDKLVKETVKHGKIEDTTYENIIDRVFRRHGHVSNKKHFASFIASNCGSSHTGTAVRHAFVYLLSDYMKLRKVADSQVISLGRCPKGSRAYKKTGFTESDFQILRNQYKDKSTLDINKDFKFSVIFENNLVPGYVSEKIVSAYYSGAIPIYFGADAHTVRKNFNPKALVYCEADPKKYSLEALRKQENTLCPNTNCREKLEDKLQKQMVKDFEPCLNKIYDLHTNKELYRQTVKENLLPKNIRDTVFDTNQTGKLLYNAYQSIFTTSKTSTAAPVQDCYKAWRSVDLKFRSPFGEDLKLYRIYLNKTIKDGHYIDFEAGDGITHSHTRFYDHCLHWKGILVTNDTTNRNKVRIVRNIEKSTEQFHLATLSASNKKYLERIGNFNVKHVLVTNVQDVNLLLPYFKNYKYKLLVKNSYVFFKK